MDESSAWTESMSRPFELISPSQIEERRSFLLRGGLVDAWFVRRSDVLVVSFDNWATAGGENPAPWLHARIARNGFSTLGIIASRKDWYRNQDTPKLLTSLRDQGLFEGFRRIIFTGASMGGYAALTYARIVPGSVVLAFSPKSTLARKIVPFDRRYKYSQRTWDWSSPEWLDAAASVSATAEIWLFYDPLVVEDRLHAQRLDGDHVGHFHLRHAGHQAIRRIIDAGLLDKTLARIGNGDFDALGFWKGWRVRHDTKEWNRGFMAAVEKSGNRNRIELASNAVLKRLPSTRFAKLALRGTRKKT